PCRSPTVPWPRMSDPGANFTPPPGTPDTFTQSATPGSTNQSPIPDAYFTSGFPSELPAGGPGISMSLSPQQAAPVPTQGGTSAPLSIISQYESGGQNVMQGVVPTSVSTASGYYQITNTTWNGFPSSITQGYPTAMSAPADVQANAAGY